MKTVFIINPISGLGNGNSIRESIQKKIDAGYHYEIKLTEYAGHGHDLAKEMAGNVDVIVAVGGDGTVLEIGSALLHSSTALGIIPSGSGNGLSRNLKIPLHPEKAIESIETSVTKSIDTGVVNDKVFISTLGIGFDALIADRFQVLSKRGFWSYAKQVIVEFFSFQMKSINITIDGKAIRKKAFILCVANSSQYGNGAIISPQSKLDDGILEVCFLKKPNLLQVPMFIYRFFTNSLDRSNLMDTFSGEVITIKDQYELFHRDGDPEKNNVPLSIKVNPLSLKVLVPQ